MSNLLSQASLVMIPSGYKEDVVYSQIPTNGNGDLSFTRASNGTRVNSAGLVEDCPWNLVEYSEQFDNAYWTKDGATITTNATTAPNGTTTAEKIEETATTGVHRIGRATFPSGTQRTLSVYAKKSERNYVSLFENNSAGNTVKGVIFNLNTGVVSTNNDSSYYFNPIIENIGNGWYRCSVNWTPSGLSVPSVGASLDGSTNSYSGTAGNGIYIYGAQLNIGSTAKPYFPTTDRLNVPRLTYQNGGGGCPSLLLEKQSTNVATQSTITSFGSGSNDWLNGPGSPASINQTTGIDGTQNGAKYTRTAGQTTDDFFYKNQVPVTFGTTYTVSGYIKLGTASNAVVVINNTVAWNTIANGNIVCSTANGFSTTAWKRFELTITAPITGLINIHFGYHIETGVTAQANGTFFLDGLQVEASSYATSLINTTSSSATRVADACFKTGISSLIGQTEGTMFVDAKNIYPSGARTIGLLFTSGSAFYQMYINSSNEVRVDVNGSFLFLGGTIAQNTQYKIAFAYKSGSNVLYINGVQIATSASTTIPSSLVDFYVGNSLSTEQSGSINQAVLFKTRLTNAELASLTTI